MPHSGFCATLNPDPLKKFTPQPIFFRHSTFFLLRGTLSKKNSIFKDIIQIEVDLPPSHPIFDKFIFDKVLIMLTSLPPLEFLTKIVTFYALNLHFLSSLLLSEGQGYSQKDTESLELRKKILPHLLCGIFNS